MAYEFERAQSSPEADVARGTKEEPQKHVWMAKTAPVV